MAAAAAADDYFLSLAVLLFSHGVQPLQATHVLGGEGCEGRQHRLESSLKDLISD